MESDVAGAADIAGTGGLPFDSASCRGEGDGVSLVGPCHDDVRRGELFVDDRQELAAPLERVAATVRAPLVRTLRNGAFFRADNDHGRESAEDTYSGGSDRPVFFNPLAPLATANDLHAATGTASSSFSSVETGAAAPLA